MDFATGIVRRANHSATSHSIHKIGRFSHRTENSIHGTGITSCRGIDIYRRIQKVKLRTAKIIEAEAVPKSEKLVKLKVDLGNEQRQILAGIAKHYSPESLIGKTIVIVANLKPAKLMGMESQGMLLAANAEDGSLGLVIPEIDIIGSEVR